MIGVPNKPFTAESTETPANFVKLDEMNVVTASPSLSPNKIVAEPSRFLQPPSIPSESPRTFKPVAVDSTTTNDMKKTFQKTAFNPQFFGQHKNPDDYLLVLPLQFRFLRKDHPVWINEDFRR